MVPLNSIVETRVTNKHLPAGCQGEVVSRNQWYAYVSFGVHGKLAYKHGDLIVIEEPKTKAKGVHVAYYICSECNATGDTKENFPHKKDCPIYEKELYDKRKELLIEYLKSSLPNESMTVYGWPGLNHIADQILIKMNADKTFGLKQI